MNLLRRLRDILTSWPDPWHELEQAERRCPCGVAADTYTAYPDDSGGFWTCAQHHGMSGWAHVSTGAFRAFWDRATPCDTCSSNTPFAKPSSCNREEFEAWKSMHTLCGGGSTLNGVYSWSCPTRPEGQQRKNRK